MDFAENEMIGNNPSETWSGFVGNTQSLQRDGWVFRAIGKWEGAKPTITSSFDNAWQRRVQPGGDRRLYESWIMSDFKREAHNYLLHLPEPNNFLEWMALGRHYGMPSRLVDFTYSFFVAAYFALSLRNKGEHGCIVALNLPRMKQQWEAKRDKEYPDFTGDRGSFHSNELFHEFAFKRRDTYAIVVNPLRRNPRLANQKGCFLCPGNIDIEVDENLRRTLGSEPDVKKLVCLRDELKTDAMEALRGMNVSQATLYPDLIGWAESRRDLVHREIPDVRFREELEIAISKPRI
jgi:FRG domain